MRRASLIVLVAVLAAATTICTGAAHAARPAAQVTKIQQLQAQVKALKTRIGALEERQTRLAALGACSLAVTFDALHNTWAILDVLAAAVSGQPYFGPQTPLDDGGACNALGVERKPAKVTSPKRAGFVARVISALNALR
jgi:hypothetical protein